MQANIHGLGFEECVVEVTLDEDERSGSFFYASRYPEGYKPKEGATLNIGVWGGPTFNAKVTDASDDPGGGATVRFQRLPT